MPAPRGNKNASRKNREYRNALLRSLKQYEANGIPRGEAIRKITDRLVEHALRGESWAIKEIADRIDGKPSLAIHGEAGTPELISLRWEQN